MGMLLASSKWLQRPNPGKRKKSRLEPLAVGFSVVHIFAGEPISPVSCPMPPGPRSLVSRPPIPCRVRPPATSGLAPPSPARPYPRFVFSPIIIDRAPETEPRDETLPARIALAVQEFPFDLRL